ncbi:glucokinase [Aeromicrobium sp. Root495]|uniref:ROK family glucokinase n=1 Tax=Aeromicrobium sp. Root495 TaxID=1736550 RepID=UPI0007000F7F|nr:ROK family glucokinase [Aeromicrobium sp. Root495]KQY59006.1 glucokinase [Aeromicrobium sp. Root495]
MSGQQHGIGVDIGGTKIAAGLVDEAGHLLRSESVPTPQEADDIAVAVADLVEKLSADGAVSGIGIGAAGFVDIDRSTVIFAPNIDWRDEPLGRDVARHTGLPVVVENDANAAAWGEFRFGAGEDADDLLLVTVGTGVGGGTVHRGQLLRGGFGVAGEVGHLRVVPDGIECGCGQRGCLEQYGSGRALVRAAKERGVELSGPEITQRAVEGDELCVDLLHDLGEALGAGIASLAAVLDPSVIAIGGGVADAGDLLLDSIRSSFQTYLPAGKHRPVAQIRLAVLGNEAGIIGAADLGRAHG